MTPKIVVQFCIFTCSFLVFFYYEKDYTPDRRPNYIDRFTELLRPSVAKRSYRSSEICSRGNNASWYVIDKETEMGSLIKGYHDMDEKSRARLVGYMEALLAMKKG